MTVRELIDVLHRAPPAALVTSSDDGTAHSHIFVTVSAAGDVVDISLFGGVGYCRTLVAEGVTVVTADEQPVSELRENALTTARRILGDDHRTFKVTRP